MSLSFKWKTPFKQIFDVIADKNGKLQDIKDFHNYLKAPVSGELYEKYSTKVPLKSDDFYAFVAEIQKENGADFGVILFTFAEKFLKQQLFDGKDTTSIKPLRLNYDPLLKGQKEDPEAVWSKQCGAASTTATVAALVNIVKLLQPKGVSLTDLLKAALPKNKPLKPPPMMRVASPKKAPPPPKKEEPKIPSSPSAAAKEAKAKFEEPATAKKEESNTPSSKKEENSAASTPGSESGTSKTETGSSNNAAPVTPRPGGSDGGEKSEQQSAVTATSAASAAAGGGGGGGGGGVEGSTTNTQQQQPVEPPKSQQQPEIIPPAAAAALQRERSNTASIVPTSLGTSIQQQTAQHQQQQQQLLSSQPATPVGMIAPRPVPSNPSPLGVNLAAPLGLAPNSVSAQQQGQSQQLQQQQQIQQPAIQVPPHISQALSDIDRRHEALRLEVESQLSSISSADSILSIVQQRMQQLGSNVSVPALSSGVAALSNENRHRQELEALHLQMTHFCRSIGVELDSLRRRVPQYVADLGKGVSSGKALDHPPNEEYGELRLQDLLASIKSEQEELVVKEKAAMKLEKLQMQEEALKRDLAELEGKYSSSSSSSSNDHQHRSNSNNNNKSNHSTGNHQQQHHHPHQHHHNSNSPVISGVHRAAGSSSSSSLPSPSSSSSPSVNSPALSLAQRIAARVSAAEQRGGGTGNFTLPKN